MGLAIKIGGTEALGNQNIIYYYEPGAHKAFWDHFRDGLLDPRSVAKSNEFISGARYSIKMLLLNFLEADNEQAKLQRKDLGIPAGPAGKHILDHNTSIRIVDSLAADFKFQSPGSSTTAAIDSAGTFDGVSHTIDLDEGWGLVANYYSEMTEKPSYVLEWSAFALSYKIDSHIEFRGDLSLDVAILKTRISEFVAAGPGEAAGYPDPTVPPPPQNPWWPRPVPHTPNRSSKQVIPTTMSVTSLDKISGTNWGERIDETNPVLAKLRTFATYYPGLGKDTPGPYVKGKSWHPRLDQISLPISGQHGWTVQKTREYQLNYYGYSATEEDPDLALPPELSEIPLPSKKQWGLSPHEVRMVQIRTWNISYLKKDPDLEIPDPKSLGEEFWCIKTTQQNKSEDNYYRDTRARGLAKIYDFFAIDSEPLFKSSGISEATITEIKKKLLDNDLHSNGRSIDKLAYIPAVRFPKIPHLGDPDVQGVYLDERAGTRKILVASPRSHIEAMPTREDQAEFKYSVFLDLDRVNLEGWTNKLARILRKNHRKIKNFNGEIVPRVDLGHEAEQLERLPGLLNKFMKLPGQGTMPEGFDFGLDDGLLEIRCDEKLRLAAINYAPSNEGFLGLFSKPSALTACRIGISALARDISVNTMHILLTYKDLIEADKKNENWKTVVAGVIPGIKIYPAGHRYSETREELQKEAAELAKKSVLTNEEKERQDELYNHWLTKQEKAQALEERRKVKDPDHDPIFEPTFLESEEWKDFERIYLKLLNQVDMKHVWQQILKCLSELAGIPLTGEALCEYLFREIIKAMGLGEVRKLLGPSMAIAMGVVDGVTTSAFGGTPEEIFTGESRNADSIIQQGLQEMSAIAGEAADGLSAAGALADHELAADSTSAISNLGYEKYQEATLYSTPANNNWHDYDATGNVASFMGATETGAAEIDSFIQEIKGFLDFKQVCEDITQAVLDLPSDFFSDPSSMFEDWMNDSGQWDAEFLLDYLPPIPTPPTFAWPERQKITHSNGDLMDVYEDALWKITASIIAGLVEGAMSELMNACLAGPSALPSAGNPGEYGAFANQFPAFADVSSPSPALSQAFDAYDLPVDNAAKFMSDVAKLLTGREMCNLFKGISPQSIVMLIRGMIERDYKEYLPALSTLPDIRMFFTHVGSFIDLQVCEEFEQGIPYIEDLCNDFDAMAGKKAALAAHGFSDEEIENQLISEVTSNLNKIKDLMSLIRQDPNKLLKEKVPTIRCEDLVPGGIMPSIAQSNKMVLNTIFGIVKNIFRKEAMSLKAIISPSPAREAAVVADMAAAMGKMDEWVGSAYDLKNYGAPKYKDDDSLEQRGAVTVGRGPMKNFMMDSKSFVLMNLPYYGRYDEDPPWSNANAPESEGYEDIWYQPSHNYYDGLWLYRHTPAKMITQHEWFERWKAGWPLGRAKHYAVILQNPGWWSTEVDAYSDPWGDINPHSTKNGMALVDFAFEENMIHLWTMYQSGLRVMGKMVEIDPELSESDPFVEIFPTGDGDEIRRVNGIDLDKRKVYEDGSKGPWTRNTLRDTNIPLRTPKYGIMSGETGLPLDHLPTEPPGTTLGDDAVTAPLAATLTQEGEKRSVFGNFPDNHEAIVAGFQEFVENVIKYPKAAPDSNVASRACRYSVGGEDLMTDNWESDYHGSSRSGTLIPLQVIRDNGLAFQLPQQDLSALRKMDTPLVPFQRMKDTLSDTENISTETHSNRKLVPGHFVPITGEDEVWVEGYWGLESADSEPVWIPGSYKRPSEYIPPTYHYDPTNFSTRHILRIPKNTADAQALNYLEGQSSPPGVTEQEALANKANNIGANIYEVLGDYDPKAARSLRQAVSLATTGLPADEPVGNDADDQRRASTKKLMDKVHNAPLKLEYEISKSDLPAGARPEDIYRVRVTNAGLGLVDSVAKDPYPDDLESVMEAAGMPPGEFPKSIAEMFAKLIVSKINNKLTSKDYFETKMKDPIIVTHQSPLPEEAVKELEEVFEKHIHPKETQRILKQMTKRVLQSPFFDAKFVDKFISKLFLNSYSLPCEFTEGTVSEKLLGLDPLRSQVDNRLKEILCRQPIGISEEDKKILQEDEAYRSLVQERQDQGMGLEPIEEASLDGMIQMRLRLSAVQIMFEYLPIMATFDVSQVMTKKYFRDIASERVRNQLLSESTEYHDLFMSRCQSILMDELLDGSGVTDDLNETFHKHTYEVDVNGDGWAVSITDPGSDPKGYGRPHRHRIKNYIVYKPRYFSDGPVNKDYDHAHRLSGEHRRLDPVTALELIFERQYSIAVKLINSLMNDMNFSHLRVKGLDDFVENVVVGSFAGGINPYQVYEKGDSALEISMEAPDERLTTSHASYDNLNPDIAKRGGAIMADVQVPGLGFYTLATEKQLLNEGGFMLQPYVYVQHKDMLGRNHAHGENTKIYDVAFNRIQADGTAVPYPLPDPESANVFGYDEQEILETDPFVEWFRDETRPFEKLNEYGVSSVDFWSKVLQQIGGGFEYLYETYAETPVGFSRPMGWNFDTTYQLSQGSLHPEGENWEKVTDKIDDLWRRLMRFDCMRPANGIFVYESETNSAEVDDKLTDTARTLTYEYDGDDELSITQYNNLRNYLYDKGQTESVSFTAGGDAHEAYYNGLRVDENGKILLDDGTEANMTTGGHCFNDETYGSGKVQMKCRMFIPDPKTLNTAGLKNLVGLRNVNGGSWSSRWASPTYMSTQGQSAVNPNYHAGSVKDIYEWYDKDLSRPNITYNIGYDDDGNVKDIYLNEDGTGNVQGVNRGFFPVQNPNYTGKITYHAIYKQYLRYLKCMRIKYLNEERLSYEIVQSMLGIGSLGTLSYDSFTSNIVHVGVTAALQQQVTNTNQQLLISKITKAEKRAIKDAFYYVNDLLSEYRWIQRHFLTAHTDALTATTTDAVTALYDVADEYSDTHWLDFGISVPKELRAGAASAGGSGKDTGFTEWHLDIDSNQHNDSNRIGWKQVYRIMNNYMVISDFADQRCKNCLDYGRMRDQGRLFPRLFLDMGQSMSSGYGYIHMITTEDHYLNNPDLMKEMADRDAELAGSPADFDADTIIGPDGTIVSGDDVGSNYTFWSGKTEKITYPAKEVVEGINLQYFHDYFDCMKYGLRLVYVPPSRPYGRWPYIGDASDREKMIAENTTIIKKIDNAFEITKESFKNNADQGSDGLVTFDRATFNDLQNVYAADKAFDIVEYDPNMAGGASDPLLLHSYNDNQWRLHPIPLADVRVNIEEIYCTAGPLEFSAFRPSEAGARHTLLAGYDVAYPKLVEKIRSTPEYRLLFHHIFPYNRFASLVTLHGGLTNQDMRMENRFKATRTTILDFIMAMVKDQELPYSMQKYGSLSNYQAGTDVTSTNAPKTDWEDIALRMMYMAPRLILKGVVQLTDPCVGTAISINDLVMTIVQTSIMIAEQVRDGIVNSLNLIISDLKRQIELTDAATNDENTGTLDLTLKLLESTIDGYENPPPPGEPAPEHIIADRRQQLDDLEAERDSLLETKIAVETALEEAQIAIEAAQGELTDAIDEVKKVVEVLSPYMVPAISFAQMPSMIPYGFLIPPPPFGPGVGPPMTSFGFIYCMLLIIEGLIDDFDKEKEEVVRELLEEEERCKDE